MLVEELNLGNGGGKDSGSSSDDGTKERNLDQGGNTDEIEELAQEPEEQPEA